MPAMGIYFFLYITVCGKEQRNIDDDDEDK
jgi:hypothetical protein